MASRRFLVLFLCVFAVPLRVCGAAGGAIWDQNTMKPSEDKGRAGTYQRKTSHPGYNYYVNVPKSYSESNPAGIHIFFHGQGSQGGAKSFWLWGEKFCEKHNLIGINMEYTDGDNSKDTAGKALAAEEAIAQTMADYKVIRGRGVISSFSGGGLVHGRIHSAYGGKNTLRFSWPFNHSAIYGSNFWRNAAGTHPMSWFIGVGTEEWNMGMPTLGSSQPQRAQELYSEAARGACPDVYFKVIKGKGHVIADEDVAASAECFARSDVFLAPYIYAGDYEERELAPIVQLANMHEYAKA
ncbi:MAG TPA: hypothetical protein ENN09_04490, partial [Planctomycetes bacterium]|nr:hypothetical protein [Planctomycetota bacterium]